MKELIKVIAFDADDTLWSNEPFFQEIEKQYTDLLKSYGTPKEISAALFQTEMGNLKLLGYGAKAFTISMVETALRISEQKITANDIQKIVHLGKSLLQLPIDLLPGVKALGEFYLKFLTKEKEVDWVFFSPAADMRPGVRTGRYRLGKDDMIVDIVGNSHISVEDYAAAMIDELEYPKHHQERFTIGY